MKLKQPTVDDVSREQLIYLAEASIELLMCARFLFWLSGGDGDTDDKSTRESLDRMAVALDAIGLPQGSIEEFEKNLEAMLKSGKSPRQWASEHGFDVPDHE